jgi:hypothetical protein
MYAFSWLRGVVDTRVKHCRWLCAGKPSILFSCGKTMTVGVGEAKIIFETMSGGGYEFMDLRLYVMPTSSLADASLATTC